MNYALIDDERSLNAVLERLAEATDVAMDTEFVRERTYRPQLCLIQLATQDLCVGIDCLAGLDLSALFDVLGGGQRRWVVHSARQDLEVIWNVAARRPTRLADTQIAGALVGFAPQLGLQDLLAELLDVRLDKEHTRADWTRRPLPEAVLTYALDDVRYLLPAWRALDDRLRDLGRRGWFEEDCARLIAEPPVPEALTIARRVRGIGELSVEERSACLALVEWRETRARDANRPRRWILDDEVLVRIASRLPQDAAGLARIPGLPPKLAARAAGDILAALADRPRHREAAEALDRTARPDKQALARLKEIARKRASELGIHAEVLATRRDLAATAVGEPPEALTSGWRAEQLAL